MAIGHFLKRIRLLRGCRVGLLGGTFNPAHEGHIHISRQAIKALHLNELWWLVTPGNPFKASPGASYEERLAHCEKLVAHEPKIFVSDLENHIKSFRTLHTVRYLQEHAPGIEFVWIGGTDIMHEIHRWYGVKELLQRIPFAFFERPPLKQNTQRAHLILRNIPTNTAAKSVGKALKAPEIFIFRGQGTVDQSSTRLREARKGVTKG